MAKKYFWFKMQEDFFKSKEVKKLRKIAGGDTYTIIYQKMILLSIRTGSKIFYSGVEDSFASEIALEIDEETDNVNIVLAFLIKHGLIDIMSDTEIVVNETLKNIGTQDESTERVRLHRERKKLKSLPLHVTNETTEIEIDQEIEKEKDSYILADDIYLSNKTKLYLECYLSFFSMPHRQVKEDPYFGYANDLDDEDFIDMIEQHFNESTIEQCNVEYFCTCVDRYR